MQVLPKDFDPYFQEIRDFLHSNSRRSSCEMFGFEDDEPLKFDRVYEIFRAPKVSTLSKNLLRLFYIFFSEHDQKRGTNFLKVFPEYEKFWNQCKLAIPLGHNSLIIRRALFAFFWVKNRICEFCIYRLGFKNFSHDIS